MTKRIKDQILNEMFDEEQYEDSDVEATEETEGEDEEQLDENPQRPQMTPVTRLKASKIEDLIKKRAAQGDAGLDDLEATIAKNKERRQRELAAQKAKDLEARMGGKIFADSKQYKGLSMVKEGYIKQLRLLLENEVEQAGVLMAAKGFSGEIQTMIEKMGRLMNEDLGPVVDNMRMAYGSQQAEAFGQAMRQDMQSIMDNLLTVKDNIDDAVDELASGQIPNMDNDMDGEIEMGGDVGTDLAIPDEIGGDFGEEDAFSGDDSAAGPEEDPLGRPQKESVEQLKQRLKEMKAEMTKLRKLKEKKRK